MSCHTASVVRNSGKAIIIRDGRLLAIRHTGRDGDWFSLPGGGQEPGETVLDALQRECIEELGVSVVPGQLRLVREYIGANHEFSREDGDFHQIDFMFECELKGDLPGAQPTSPDERQIGVEWLPLATLSASSLFPKELRKLLADGLDSPSTVYLGDVN